MGGWREGRGGVGGRGALLCFRMDAFAILVVLIVKHRFLSFSSFFVLLETVLLVSFVSFCPRRFLVCIFRAPVLVSVLLLIGSGCSVARLSPCSCSDSFSVVFFSNSCVCPPPMQTVVVAGKDKGPPLKLDLDITSEDLEKKLRECLASRGRKATDPKVSTWYSMLSTALTTQQLILNTSLLNTFDTQYWVLEHSTLKNCCVDVATLPHLTLRNLALYTSCYLTFPCVTLRYRMLPCFIPCVILCCMPHVTLRYLAFPRVTLRPRALPLRYLILPCVTLSYLASHLYILVCNRTSSGS